MIERDADVIYKKAYPIASSLVLHCISEGKFSQLIEDAWNTQEVADNYLFFQELLDEARNFVLEEQKGI